MISSFPVSCSGHRPCQGRSRLLARRGDICRAPLVRMVVILLFLIGQCPVIAASLIMAAATGGDHQVVCSLNSREIKVVLAHQACAATHRHNFAERCLLKKGSEEDHSDHAFRFARENSITSSTELTPPSAPDSTIAGFSAAPAVDPGCSSCGHFRPTPRPPPWLGTNAPIALLQCIVMRN